MKSQRTCKIITEFPTPEAALAWFDEVKANGHWPERADAFEADALDLGRAAMGDYIVRNRNERPEHTSLRSLVAARAAAFAERGKEARNRTWKAKHK